LNHNVKCELTLQHTVIDLKDCDREPIHIPSAILLVVGPPSERVIQAGVGAERLIPLSSPPLGQRLTDVLGVPAGIVADQGRGMERTEHADGFGSCLTGLLVSQLEGAIEFQNNFPGTKVVLSIPQAA
jgi:hypothetical protein